ncbi:unnamed protein product [Kuraishia capsulata CBS 1993]|uniref:Uncharacterized protein n=1 Tax=Kuraishia capsulata CBS 1993 TaxID=1382522 RepID=W6MME0_9ASCO|nr:uncharacterized protein KUCA_T00003346001 [Kuraishia capsulata CBS 1993]CDK27368.1 unnamed protein product [Kuraishia capsulata CBS 1993]
MSSSITQLIKSQTNNAADGTGIKKLVKLTQNLLHTKTIPKYLVDYVQAQQQSQFGGYPDHKDIAPSAIFTAVFAIFFIAHLSIFIKNYSRGHIFWPGLALAFYALCRWLGFALRIVWAKNIMKIDVGLASEVLLALPILFLATINLILAQRVFTWAHPAGGNSRPYWIFMSVLYFAVFAVVLMTIVAGVIPYLYFLSEKHFNMCKNVMKVSAILDVLYTLTAISLILLSWILPTTANDRAQMVYQPTWIESFHLLYYPPRGAAQRAEREFVERHGTHVRPARTITFVHTKDSRLMSFFKFNNVHSASLFLIARTSFLVLIGAVFRAVGLFLNRTAGQKDWIYKPVVMYILWGLLETIINIWYLVDRIDLRFYKPSAIRWKKYGEVEPKAPETDRPLSDDHIDDKPAISMRSSANTEEV